MLQLLGPQSSFAVTGITVTPTIRLLMGQIEVIWPSLLITHKLLHTAHAIPMRKHLTLCQWLQLRTILRKPYYVLLQTEKDGRYSEFYITKPDEGETVPSAPALQFPDLRGIESQLSLQNFGQQPILII